MLKLSIGVVPAMCSAFALGSTNIPGEAEHLKPIAVLPPPLPPAPAEPLVPPLPALELPALPPLVAPAFELPLVPLLVPPLLVALPPLPAFVALPAEPDEPPFGVPVEPPGALFALHAAHRVNANKQERRSFI
jgi:hypothetical protein